MKYLQFFRRGFQKQLSQEWLLILSFAGIIFLGTLLLMLPISCTGDSLSFIDALFTATSATCVTGLSVVDTGTKFTLFGQITILVLIQLGGLGITVFSIALLYLFERQLSLTRRDMLSEVLNQGPTQNLTELLKTVFIGTFFIEAVGAFLLTYAFSKSMPWDEALYSGIFHSISAYCNAGFGLHPDNLIRYQGDVLVNFTICM
ncbi:MAG: potassium transporter TrkG, partial [Planctomycetota bacterium]